MALSSEEARVLACLIEKQVTVPDTYPLTLNALRLACNQTSSRHPVVTYDDRTVEQALLSLKSMGLVRYVHPAQGGRTTRYRHIADERWHLSPADLGVLSVLDPRVDQSADWTLTVLGTLAALDGLLVDGGEGDPGDDRLASLGRRVLAAVEELRP